MAQHSPLQQFEIHPIIRLPEIAGYEVHFTNSALAMTIAVGFAILLFGFGLRSRALVPGRLQNISELSYEFIANMLRDNVGEGAKPYFPFIFTLFMFVLFSNLFGMIPGNFTPTSHIIVTFALAIFIFIAVTVIGVVKHGFHFLKLFLPEGIPLIMAPMMFLIELFAYLARPVSLSVRLAANMMAGHTMLKVIAGFVVSLGVLLGWAPLALLVVLTGFEIFIALLQAYIFTVLTCIYLKDAIHLH